MLVKVIILSAFWSQLTLQVVYNLQVEVLSLLTVDPSLASSLGRTGAALSIAIEDVNHEYADQNLTFTIKQLQDVRWPCATSMDNSIRLLLDYYFKSDPGTCHVILAIGGTA